MYVENTVESVRSIERGEYRNGAMASELVRQVARRFLEPLHHFLLSGANVGKGEAKSIPPEWKAYYDLAQECNSSDLRVLGTGVNTHLTFDLPHALSDIKAPDSFKEDFLEFGSILIRKKGSSSRLLELQQKVYAETFFDLFFFGKALDSLFPKGTASTWGFQLIRAEAWQNSRSLQSKALAPATKLGVHVAWMARQAVLVLMPKSNPSMNAAKPK
jgi:Family of unknown function (DUF5995)